MALLEPFGADIWVTDGPIAAVAGFRYPTRMAVIRLAGGALFVWSPTAYSPALGAEVDALGEVRFIVTPTALHHLHLAQWRGAYSRARLYAAPGSRARSTDVAFDEDLTDDPSADWAGQIDQAVVYGNLIATEVVFFHRASRVVLFADLLQQFERGWFSGWRAAIARLDRMVGDEPQTPRKFRLAFVDRRAARKALTRVLAWPTQKVVMAHAPPVREDGRAVITRAFRWLL